MHVYLHVISDPHSTTVSINIPAPPKSNVQKKIIAEREGRDYIYNLGRETAVPWQIHDHGHPLLYFEPL